MSTQPQPTDNQTAVPGQALSLDQMAQMHLKRGQLDQARTLFEQSLQQKQQAGDMRGSAASLSNLAHIHLAQEQPATAEQLLHQSLFLYQHLQDPQGGAFQIVKLGQLAQLRHDHETALAHYHEGLAIFERLGSSGEVAQVQQMISELAGERGSRGAAMSTSGELSLAWLLQQARQAAERGDTAAAITAQETAVQRLREAREDQPTLISRSVALYHLAGYYSNANRHNDAVQVLEEVVELNQQTAHPELSQLAPRALDGARKMVALSPADQKQLLAQVQQTAATLALQRKADRMSNAERTQLLTAAQRVQIETLANQTRDATIQALRGEADRQDLAAQMERVAEQAAAGKEDGSPWLEVAAFVRGVAAVLRGKAAPPIPTIYGRHMTAILETLEK